MRSFWVYLIGSASLWAVSFSGEGVSADRNEALRMARSELSHTLLSEVRSSFESAQSSSGEGSAYRLLRITSQLPIIAAEIAESQRGSETRIIATLSSEKSLSAYLQKITDVAEAFHSTLTPLRNASSKAARIKGYEDLLRLSDEHRRLRSVALLLGANRRGYPPSGDGGGGDPRRVIRTHRIDRFDRRCGEGAGIGGSIIAGVYVRNPSAMYSSLPTPFAMAVRDKLSAHLGGRGDESGASVIAEGRYVINPGSIDITYTYLDPLRSVVLGVRSVTLPIRAAAGYEYHPQELAFEEALSSGMIVSGDFKATLSTNKGSRDLSFRGGEVIEPLVKLSQMGSFYIVGHTKNAQGSLSYLVDLNEHVTGDGRYIRTIAPEEINRVLSLGAFEVVEPFGMESLQLIALSGSTPPQLPPYRIDPLSGLAVIGEDLPRNVITTRAISKKQSAPAKAEASILYRTAK
jgi:hypothetical protein